MNKKNWMTKLIKEFKEKLNKKESKNWGKIAVKFEKYSWKNRQQSWGKNLKKNGEKQKRRKFKKKKKNRKI